MSASEDRFSSRLGLILSVLGIAVGTGNIWRFPRIAAQNAGPEGAGAFLLAWLAFLFLWSIPLIIAEYALGRAGRRGVVGSFAAVVGPRLAWMGTFVGLVATAIMFYYSVVAGWCFSYLLEVSLSPLPVSTDESNRIWEQLQAGPRPVVFHALAMGVGALAVWRGVGSIEKVNKVLIPSLLLVVVISLIRALTLPGSAAGIRFLFTPDWGELIHAEVWLEALTQNAWDTGAGWGLILSYASYMRTRDAVVKNAMITGIGNNIVSLLAAMTVFGTVFAILGAEMSRSGVLDIMQQSGPASTGLTFIWMPQLFAKMPMGRPLAMLFFLGLSFAALSSLIAMIELAVRVLVDAGIARGRAVAAIAIGGFLLGLPSALDTEFLGNQDFVWGLGLIISGTLIAIAVVRHGTARFRRTVIDAIPGDWAAGRVWDVAISVLVPAQAVMLLVWWLHRSATRYAPEAWADPLQPYSVMTCLVQWGAALALCLALNRFLTRRFSR